jgi:hypothetical protein
MNPPAIVATAGLRVQRSLTSHWPADPWEDQNVTSPGKVEQAIAQTLLKRAFQLDESTFHTHEQPSKAAKLVKVKQVKEEASDTLFNSFPEVSGVQLQRGDDIADARLQQLAWAHNKVKSLAAQLQAAQEQCAQLQTASNSVPLSQVSVCLLCLCHLPVLATATLACCAQSLSRPVFHPLCNRRPL